MAEHDADREPDEKDAPPGGEQGPSFDETAAWEAIVAGYGDEPPDPPGAKPFKSVEDLALLEPETNDAGGGPGGSGGSSATPKGAKGKQSGTDGTGSEGDSEADAKAGSKDEPGAGKPLGSSVAFAPGVAGPRDFTAPEPAEEDFDEDDEGHFVPPEPPPLPAADATAKFAWLGVIGGPVLLLLAVLLGWEMTWYLATLGIGGFLGGFATLVGRMRSDEEDEDDPGRGAVV
ncbi:hypothetical protein GCM10010372_73140 [Streptomyces tauricus]|uniref:Uncharacterized protein n=1 Tax=Streptomyces tauricus TaxID=68274 RepID=A0ABZ1JR72_9ACTN|nr:hypothetical protein [Streptomyces tauricus]MCW8101069.1 hypothetical protein [Streptomyces tauricus]GHA62676.1 hypothetical protein GCM10010372_73140 [Streptomyces tauricus]